MKGSTISRIKDSGNINLDALNVLLEQQSPGKKNRSISKGDIQDALRNDNFYLFIIKDTEDTYIGMGTIFFQRNLARWIAEIHDIVVDEKFRGSGYGESITKKLMHTALDFSKQKNCKLKLFLTSRPSRVAANSLYRKLGFVLVAKSNGEWGTNLYKIIVEPSGFRNFNTTKI